MCCDLCDIVWSCFYINFVLILMMYEYILFESMVCYYDVLMCLIQFSLEKLLLVIYEVCYDVLVCDFDMIMWVLCDFIGVFWLFEF